MNIELSTKEYSDLLDILHIVDVIMSGHRRQEDMRSARHRALIQKFYALAREAGLDSLIGYNETVHKHVPTAKFEESSLAHVLINEFRDHIFWDELISRLSARDAALTTGGIDRFDVVNDSMRQAAVKPIRQRYIEEFSTNGVANLAVVERFGTGERKLAKTSD